MSGKLRQKKKSLSPASAPFTFANFQDLGGPSFIVTVDTEEEFDWNKPFARAGHGTNHLKSLPRFQALCEDYGIIPCYLVDLPIVEDSYGADLLAGYAHRGRAEIGAHLHPWVNPPFDEQLDAHNSYVCNLPPALERAKLSYLYNAIVQRMGVTPIAYRAGRYGAGAATVDILKELGICIDTSIRARFDYSDQNGPDYSCQPVHPYWIDHGQLLVLPLTTIFGGALRNAGDRLFGQWVKSQSARSILSRSNLLERIALTPEGIPLNKALRAIDLALIDNVPIINISLHSPSVDIGHTPYVRDAVQLETLYAWLGGVFNHLYNRGVRPTNMAEIKRASRITSLG